jgi:hypothetical protein
VWHASPEGEEAYVERDNLNNAARTLEDAFFAKENARLRQQMRERG